MTHAVHEKPHRVLSDDCGECRYRARSGLDGLSDLDPTNLAILADLAAEMKQHSGDIEDASDSDMLAVETLRHAARIVYASGITEEAAR